MSFFAISLQTRRAVLIVMQVAHMNVSKGLLELSVLVHLDTSLPMIPRPVKISMNVTPQDFVANTATMKEGLLGATVMKIMF